MDFKDLFSEDLGTQPPKVGPEQIVTGPLWSGLG